MMCLNQKLMKSCHSSFFVNNQFNLILYSHVCRLFHLQNTFEVIFALVYFK